MSLNAKEFFLNDVEDLIGEYLTGAHTKRVINDIDNQLVGYNLEMLGTDYKPGEDDIIQAFLNAKTVEGKSDKTIAHYAYVLEKAFAAIGVPAAKASTDDIREYLANEQARGLSNRTLNGERSVLSSFYGWVWREGYVNRNPMGNVGVVKYRKEVKAPYSEVELAKLKEACSTLRETALIQFLLSTGCRVNEAVCMDVDDIDFDRLECKVLGKGNKERIVYMTPVTAMTVKRYLEERHDDCPALFAGKRGRLTTNGIRVVLKQIEHRSGVENVHPHRFRRTLATTLINRGMPIQDVAKILGHANINTTLAYVYIDRANVKHQYERYI